MELKASVAEMHTLLGRVLREQKKLTEARQNLEKALALLDGLSARDPANTVWQARRGATAAAMGFLLVDEGDLAGATALLRSHRDAALQRAAAAPASIEAQRQRVRSHDALGFVLRRQADLAGARAEYEAGVASLQALVAAHPEEAVWSKELACLRSALAGVAAPVPAGAVVRPGLCVDLVR